jgi:DNA-binding transcriptional LysR family regulator
MICGNLRHLRVFLAVAGTGSVTRAAERARMSQPAVTQAMARLAALAGTPLLARTPGGFVPTEAGRVVERRARRAFDILDAALAEVAGRLVLTATRAQIDALIATAAAQGFSLAARDLGVAQPTVHRAVAQLEREAGRPLFQRAPTGAVPTRAGAALARAAQLALVELDQADAELGEIMGREVGRIVIGAMPLSRSCLLPQALTAFRRDRPGVVVQVLEGTYDAMLGDLRRGEIDFLIGALRDPPPVADVVQERLFDDDLVLLAGPGHPALGRALTPAALHPWPWLVPRAGTPTRRQFDAMFAAAALAPPRSVIETGSVLLMREVLRDGHHLACVSRAQAEGEIARGLVRVLDHQVPGGGRPIGLTMRVGWQPTPAQAAILAAIRSAV